MKQIDAQSSMTSSISVQQNKFYADKTAVMLLYDIRHAEYYKEKTCY